MFDKTAMRAKIGIGPDGKPTKHLLDPGGVTEKPSPEMPTKEDIIKEPPPPSSATDPNVQYSPTIRLALRENRLGGRKSLVASGKTAPATTQRRSLITGG